MHANRLSSLQPREGQGSLSEQRAAALPRPEQKIQRVGTVIPSPPPKVAALLEVGVRERRLFFPSDGGTRVVEEWAVPPITGREIAGEICAHLAEVEAILAPADRGTLLARILALLSHFRAEPNPPQIEQMMADDWAEDLAPYPMWAVDEAARQWRRTRKWRPQICELIALCSQLVGEAELRRQRLRAMAEATEQSLNPFAARTRELAWTMHECGFSIARSDNRSTHSC